MIRVALHSFRKLNHPAVLAVTALTRLESITGIPGFPARALIRKGDYRDPEGDSARNSPGAPSLPTNAR